MSGTSFFTFFLGQADKIILSKLLSLENFGYYSLAVTLNDQLQLVNAQIVQPLFPRFSALVSQEDRNSLKNLYHKACQLVSVVILPIAGTAAFFSHELVYIWTQNMQVASIVAPIASLLFVGTIFFNFIEIPVSLAIAHGWVKLAFYRVLVLSLLSIPLVIVLSLRLNGIGAALAWALTNLVQLLIFPFVFHRRILIHELHHWYTFDVGIPVIISLVILGLARWLMPPNLSSILYGSAIGLAALTLFGLLILSSNEVRAWAIELGKKYFPKYFETW
jgi:O-antigen/teichoic acid export membrane protein